MSVLDEIFEGLASGEIKGKSELNLRNEKLQARTTLARIGRLERALRKRSKLLVPIDLALPFNPLTGKADEQYNADVKWRPPISATSAAMYLKRSSVENQELYNTLVSRAGMDEWDLSEPEVLNDMDKKIFRSYRYPRVFTVPTVSVTDERINGNPYPNDYAIEVKRDPITGAVIGDWPIPLQVNKVYRDMAYEHRSHIEDCIKKAKDGEPYELKTSIDFFRMRDQDGVLGNITEKEFKDKIKEVYSEILISEDRPSNYLIVIEMLLGNDLTLKDKDVYETFTADDVKKLFRTTRRTAEFLEAFENFNNGTWNKHDVHFDFWEIDMICPTQVDDPDDKMLIGKGTRYNNPDSKLKDESEFYDKFAKSFRDAIDESRTIESQFMHSVYIRKYDDTVQNKVLAVMEARKELENPFMTDKVIEQNKNILSLVYGNEEVLDLITASEEGMSDREAGSLDADASQAQAKLELGEILNGNTVEPDAEPTAEGEDASVSAELIELEVQ